MSSKKKVKKTNNNSLVCSNCGSSNIQTKMWVNSNTDEVMDSCSDGNIEDNWCEDCEKHTEQITLKEFKNK